MFVAQSVRQRMRSFEGVIVVFENHVNIVLLEQWAPVFSLLFPCAEMVVRSLW